MSDELSGSPATSAPSDPAPAPAPEHAAPSSTPAPAGDASAPAASSPSAPASPDTPHDWEKRYKEVQALATRASQAAAGYAQYGTLEQLQQRHQFLEALAADPDFQEFTQRKLAKQTAGQDDPDTVRALQIIDQRAQAIADQRLEAAIGPLRAQAVQQRIDTTFAQMDKAHGPEWREQREKMSAILSEGIRAGHFAPTVEQNFDLRTLNMLYAAATASDPVFAAKQYEKRLKAKQSAAVTASPGTAPSAVGGQANSIEAAFALARKQHGW